VRANRDDIDRALQQALAAYHVPGVEAPPNYSVRIGGEGGAARSARGLSILYQSSSLAARSRRPSRIVKALAAFLASHREEPFDLLTANVLAFVADDGHAILAPRVVANAIEQVQPRAERKGLRIVDSPLVGIDVDTGEIVVEPGLELDGDVLARLDTDFPPSIGEPEPVAPGRYPLRGWAVFGASEAAGPVSRAVAVAGALGSILMDGHEGQPVLDALATVFGRVQTRAIWYEKPAEVVAQLLEIAAA